MHISHDRIKAATEEMTVIYELNIPQKAAPLFEGWHETMIWSCLQGIMGKIYTDNIENPACAMAVLGDFYFLAGKPNTELAQYEPQRKKFRIIVPQNDAIAACIESCYKNKAKKVTRYAIKKEPKVFDKKRLQSIVDSLSDSYELRMVDEEMFGRLVHISWCKDWVSQYSSYQAYQKYGIGAVICKDGEPVSGASSYSGYAGGIEVEIDTRKDYRRKGLASVCGAKLVLECLERGWYPSWDAQNLWSVALAEKLGYHFDRAYPAYEIF